MIGSIPAEMLEATLEALPVEFSVVDAQDKVRAWSKHATRIFRRGEDALGRDVHDCHPKKSLDKVEQILNEMKSGKRDTARFWLDIPMKDGAINPAGGPRKVMIEYFAIRGTDGTYLGCLEASRDITDIQKLEGQNRLVQ